MEHPKTFAFVLMPFDPSFEDIYRFGIKEPASTLDMLAERVDEQIYQEGILERIYRQIEVADVVIADMTGKNPNVFYEVGYAHAKGKLCILLTANAEDIPFDLKHRRHIVYGGSIKTLRALLVEELRWAQREIENVRRTHIKANPQRPFGELKRSKFLAEGEVHFKIDLVNDADKTSPEIEALYFYSSKSWTLYQDDKECPSTVSDIGGFEKRHFLTPPLRRLQRGAWAQVQFKSRKILATAFQGEELKDSYRVSGRSVLRLVTSDGNFDYEIPIDVSIDDIPF
jgi:hypothetical protein